MGFWDSLSHATRAGAAAALSTLRKADDDDDEEDGLPDEDGPSTIAVPKDGAGNPSPITIDQLEEALTDPKSLFWDPFAVIDALGYKDKPTSVGYGTLQQMVWQMPIIQSIILRRQNQVANFCRPQVSRFMPGFKVTLEDSTAEETDEVKKECRSIEAWLLTTGTTDNPEGRDNFETFGRKLVRDALTYDQACMEVVPSRSGKPAEFYAVDAATIRIADTTKLRFDEDDVDQIRYVQVYDGLVVSEYTARELCFGIRNPVTDIRNQGYGRSELEMLVSTVTSLLWSWDYNQKFFSQGTSSKGIINFKGAIPDKQLRAFRRHWYSLVAGVENAFKTPIVNAEDMQYIDLAKSNKDMEFSAWFDFLIKVACAIYGMDPMEINFKYGDSGGAGTMFESSGKQKLTESKDNGLKPLLRTMAGWITTFLVKPLNPDLKFEFMGLEAESPSEEADLFTKQVKSTKTINELRALDGDPPLPNGDIILDPVFFQAYQMSAHEDAEVGDFSPEPEPDPDDPFSQLDGDLSEGAVPGPDKASDAASGPPDAAAKGAKPAPPDGVQKSLGSNRITIDIDL